MTGSVDAVYPRSYQQSQKPRRATTAHAQSAPQQRLGTPASSFLQLNSEFKAERTR
jgi:hypothetical protein